MVNFSMNAGILVLSMFILLTLGYNTVALSQFFWEKKKCRRTFTACNIASGIAGACVAAIIFGLYLVIESFM